MLVFGVWLFQVAFVAQIYALPILDAVFSSATTRRSTPTVCNGYAELCDRQYSNITFIGTHDTAFKGILPTQNQIDSVTDILNGGIRFLQSQTHVKGNTLEMCHTSCLEEDGGSVQSFLTTVMNFLNANPNEVVTLLLTNGDYTNMSYFASVYESVPGLVDISYKPTGNLAMNQWPTLGQMISDGTRLVTFIDYDANEDPQPYLIQEFNYFWETPYDTTDSKFAECTIDRKNSLDADGKNSMYLVNHYLDISILGIDMPDMAKAASTNAVSGTGSIGAQADLCAGTFNRYPNVLLIDYFGLGDAIGAQKMLNGLS